MRYPRTRSQLQVRDTLVRFRRLSDRSTPPRDVRHVESSRMVVILDKEQLRLAVRDTTNASSRSLITETCLNRTHRKEGKSDNPVVKHAMKTQGRPNAAVG
uniref:Transposase Tc1-like domain-containing protein n=1 Tax=Panagrellus redivivus TaxID=6233 RepID=A0A7E4W8Q1_PANRE